MIFVPPDSLPVAVPAPKRARRTRPPGRFTEPLSMVVERGAGERYHRAAERDGLPRSEWMRNALDAAAERSERAARRSDG